MESIGWQSYFPRNMLLKTNYFRIHLESAYTTMAIFVVEVPCGYTAAVLVCLVMTIQEATISNDSIELECSNRIHALVMSIMSLVCWVHNACVRYLTDLNISVVILLAVESQLILS